MGSIGAPELIIVLLVVLFLFGSTKLPKLARSIGEASKEFKKGVSEGAGQSDAAPSATAAPAAAPDDRVTMTRAELDALLAEREAQARKDAPPAV
jgi:sec-independent protein translocase protein TatA